MKEGGLPTMTPAGNTLETASRVSELLLYVASVMNLSEAADESSDGQGSVCSVAGSGEPFQKDGMEG